MHFKSLPFSCLDTNKFKEKELKINYSKFYIKF
jgi:hypothetical protein